MRVGAATGDGCRTPFPARADLDALFHFAHEANLKVIYQFRLLNPASCAIPDLAQTSATTPPTPCANSLVPCLQSEWWQATLTAPDQLRQRVAFALAEQFVVSTNSVNSRGRGIPEHSRQRRVYEFLHDHERRDALNCHGSVPQYDQQQQTRYGERVAQIANENYSRELMQLFTLGLVELDSDGTPQMDSSGNTIPTYTQAQVQAFARAYTGWTFATSTGGSPSKFPNQTTNYTMPMAAVESAHDTNPKILLAGTTLPAGQTAEQDLAGALQNIFNQPNVGPFVCRQLIQHLVSSDPTPAYVSRVAAVFANNGNNVRGDMKAVLLDSEARAGESANGHLREPVLWLTDVMRALNFTNNDAVAGNDIVGNASFAALGNYTSTLSQKPYASASVFNFFPPNYYIPGSSTNAPEFGIENTASAVARLSLANTLVYNRISRFNVDLSATSTLGKLASNPGNLVDTLGQMFMHAQMPSDMRSAIVNQITSLTDPAQRVRVAVYLVITSSQYKIEH